MLMNVDEVEGLSKSSLSSTTRGGGPPPRRANAKPMLPHGRRRGLGGKELLLLSRAMAPATTQASQLATKEK